VKLRESGMPEEAYWKTLFNVELILDRLGIDSTLRDVAELGCGYGIFTSPVARRISGMLRAYDIDPAMVERANWRLADAGSQNGLCVERDVFMDGFGLPSKSQDACLLFNILHCEEPVRLLEEAARVIHQGGVIHVIHWRSDIETPRGPSLDIRPKPEQVITWAGAASLDVVAPAIIDLLPWHYGIRFRKQASEE
jgi:SAM-dependent methyltransferase